MLAKSFEIRVRGTIPPDLVAEFASLEAEVVSGETVLRGVLPDQAALYGVLLRLQALGLELVEVRQAPADRDGWSTRDG